jgi:hypothetical protein
MLWGRSSRPILLTIALALAVAAPAQGARAPEQHAFSFSKWERPIAGHILTVDVDTVEIHGRGVWMARLTNQAKQGGKQTSWADSGSCPAMMPAFASLQAIEPFTITPPGIPGKASVVIMDGDNYEVHASGYWPLASRNGEIVLSSNTGPVAQWVDETLKVLAPCWRKQRPGG